MRALDPRIHQRIESTLSDGLPGQAWSSPAMTKECAGEAGACVSGGQKMSSRARSAMSFVERHGLWPDEQFAAAAQLERAIADEAFDVVRFSFADQHGVLRGKTVAAAQAPSVMRDGCSATTTLLAKDTSHRTVFPVFTGGGGFGMAAMEGGGDFLMIADPTTFRVLPWAPQTGWMLSDIYFGNGEPVPF